MLVIDELLTGSFAEQRRDRRLQLGIHGKRPVSPQGTRYSADQPRDPEGQFATTGHGKGTAVKDLGEGYRPGAWTASSDRAKQVDEQAKIFAETIADYVPKDWTQAQIDAEAHNMADETVPAAASTVYTNGPHKIVIQGYEPDTVLGPSGMDAEKIKALMRTVDSLQTRFPVPGALKIVVASPKGFSSNVLGETYIGTGNMRLNSRMFNEDGHVKGMMPEADRVSKADYVLTHEWGHTQMDKYSSGVMSKARELFRDQRWAGSVYGRETSEEAFAEAWAEFHLSDGKTTNVAALAYAEAFKW